MVRNLRGRAFRLLCLGAMLGGAVAEAAPVTARLPNPRSWAPPGLPAHVSAVQTAVQSLRGATTNQAAIGAGAIKKGTAPRYTPRPPATGVPTSIPSGAGGNNNYGGTSTTPAPAGTTFVRLTGIIVARGASVTRCNPNGNCGFEPGDTLTITATGGFMSLGREVHFVTFPGMQEQVVAPIAWTDSAIIVQVPRLSAGSLDGTLYLGVPNSGASSTFWGYHFNPTLPTIVSQFVVFDSPPLPQNVQFYRPTRFAWPETTSAGAVDGKTRFEVTRSGFFATSQVSDTFLVGGRLVNG